jgi:hypothetical protein
MFRKQIDDEVGPDYWQMNLEIYNIFEKQILLFMFDEEFVINP